MAEQWDPDVELSRHEARHLIETQHPELAPAELAVIGRGWDNDAYLVNGEWVFRFPRREIAAPLIEIERAVLPHIAGLLPLAVPDPAFAGVPAEGYPYVFSGHRLIPGTVACEADPDDRGRHSSAAVLGSFLGSLHATHLGDTATQVPPDVIGRSDLERRTAAINDRLDRLVALGVDVDHAPVRTLVDRLAVTAPWPHAPRLVHGDLYSCHLLVDDHGVVSGVIDWGDVHWGDPALDLSIAYSYLLPSSRESLFAAYGDVTAADRDRARSRALHYGALLWLYGLDVESGSIVAAGRQALERAAL